MAATEKAKRRWGKTRNREKITIIDRMEIEDSLHKFAEEVKSFKERHEVVHTSKQNHDLDLQQPELMSDFALVEALKKIRVPIPVYADGKPSRERLIYLFRQHVIPRPQRQSRRPLRRRDRKLRRGGGQTESSASCKTEDAGPIAMEVDGVAPAESDDYWALNSDGSWVLPLERKRKSEAGLSDSVGAPPEKKVLLEPSSAHQTLTSSIADVNAVTKEPAVRKIIKLKRPGRAAPPLV